MSERSSPTKHIDTPTVREKESLTHQMSMGAITDDDNSPAGMKNDNQSFKSSRRESNQAGNRSAYNKNGT